MTKLEAKKSNEHLLSQAAVKERTLFRAKLLGESQKTLFLKIKQDSQMSLHSHKNNERVQHTFSSEVKKFAAQNLNLNLDKFVEQAIYEESPSKISKTQIDSSDLLKFKRSKLITEDKDFELDLNNA